MKNNIFLSLQSRRTLWAAQCALSGLALAMAAWFLTDYVKGLLFGRKDFGLYAWTFLFFHPVEGNLLNYLALCLVLGTTALFAYTVVFSRSFPRMEGRLQGGPLRLAAGSIAFSFLLLAFAWFQPSLQFRVLSAAGVTCLPLLWLGARVFAFIRPGAPLLLRAGSVLSVILLVWMGSEQLAFFWKPVGIMNEYAHIYGETRIKDQYVNNRMFLERLTEEDMKAVKVFFELLPFLGYHRYPEPGESSPFPLFRKINLEPARAYLASFLVLGRSASLSAEEGYRTLLSSLNPRGRDRTQPSQEPGSREEIAPLLARLQDIDVEALKIFYNANTYEHRHQNMGRGQINHISYILNPLNEYQMGKPLRDIYMQYGLGNTLLMKWIMDCFGGISLHNYYRTYLLYSAYFLLFWLMALYLFKDGFYAFTAFSALPVCFLLMGYTAFIVAPGIVPSIRLLDAPAVVFWVWYLRSGRPLALGCLTGAVLSAIVLNPQFGLALVASLIVAWAFFFLEGKKGKARIFSALFLIGFAGAALVVLRAVQIGHTTSIFPYFVSGLFSWPVRKSIVVLTLLYLIISYIFLLTLRKDRSDLKYAYIFIFAYSQATLLYFFWSGLVNHLPPVLSFLWLQLLLMIFILQKRFAASMPVWPVRAYQAVALLALVNLFLLVPGALHFYQERGEFSNNFRDHQMFRWSFVQATGVSTMDPRLIEESISLIQNHHTGKDRGIFMLSKYDALLPFLAGRFSAMPFPELTSFIFSPREYGLTLRAIRDSRPAHLFVDSNIHSQGDAWGILYAGDRGYVLERGSRLSRYELLRNLFEEVAADYEKVAEGRLISVYRRIPGR